MARTEISVAEALSRAHQALRTDLQKLDDSVDLIPGQDLPALRAPLAATRSHINEHFRFEEQNGYMDKVRKREPRLEHTIEQLAAEHRQLAQSLDAIIKRAKDAPSLDPALRDQIREWIASVRQHEAREDDLVQNAFNLDIGAED
jgi:hemerythrin-like domain-containing protein